MLDTEWETATGDRKPDIGGATRMDLWGQHGWLRSLAEIQHTRSFMFLMENPTRILGSAFAPSGGATARRSVVVAGVSPAKDK